jgi:uncharacterized protein YqjF (DUF2071 family)
MDDDFLELVSHRPFPLPRGRWLWRQRWDSVLLLHFRVASAAIGPLVPPQLTLDEADGSAWVSVVPFRMCNVRPRYLPAIGPLSNFAELNVRTYVRAEGKPGVFFLSIHARGTLVAWLARTLSPLDYRPAALDWQAAQSPQAAALGPGAVSFRSPLVDVDFASGGAIAPEHRKPLDTFLTERYCLYASTPAGVVRVNVHHLPWPLVEPRVRLLRNEALHSLAAKNPLQPDVVHLSPGVEVAGWPNVQVSA